MLGFFFLFCYKYSFSDEVPSARDLDVPPFPMNFPKIWGVSPHIPIVCFSAPAFWKLGGTLITVMDLKPQIV